MTTSEIHEWNIALVGAGHRAPKPEHEEGQFYQLWFRTLIRVWMRRIGQGKF